MNPTRPLILLALLALTLSAPLAAAAPPSFVTIDVPGAAGTSASGIHQGVVVGTFIDSRRFNFAFRFDGVTYQTLLPPTAITSGASGIDQGVIVGGFLSNKIHGYVLDGGTYYYVDPPQTGNFANGANAGGIDGENIVGQYVDAGGRYHSFLWNGANYVTFDPPSSSHSGANDIEGSTIVGYFQVGSPASGYIYDGANFTTLNYPGATSTFANAVSNGRVVGYYTESPLRYHGYIYEAGVFTPFDIPATLGYDTRLHGIDRNTIVGEYTDNSGKRHGFIATIPEPAGAAILLALTPALAPVRRNLLGK
jgi:hypothetical protein